MKMKRIIGTALSASLILSATALSLTKTINNSYAANAYPKIDNSVCDEIIADGRSVIGYFASWRNNELGQYFTYKDLPWGKMTTINYAFASVGNWGDGENAHHFKTSANDDTGRPWDGTPEDLNGLFLRDTIPQIVAPKNYECWISDSDRETLSTLVSYKNNVSPKTRIILSVGGWASSGEFYPMLGAGKLAWQEFSDSAVKILRDFNIDGIDVDFEHPSTVGSATAGGLSGNPQNFSLSEVGTDDASVYINYVGFIRTLNETIDAASAVDNREYLLTAAGSASGWVLRGEALSEYCQMLDYINIMSYDFHGAWNKFVWHQSPIYGANGDPEIADTNGYANYLSVDWAVRYYQGAMPSERINVGVPYYTRGWVDVSDGSNGLGGTTPHPSMVAGKAGEATEDKTDTGVVLKNSGADGVDGLWNDPAPELPAGANSIYHMKNLLDGRVTESMKNILKNYWGYSDSEINDMVLRVQNDYNAGNGYKEFFDDASGVPYIWNDAQKSFHTFENEKSIKNKCEYIVNNNLGGYMTWEFSGDFGWDDKKKEWTRGHTLTTAAAETLKNASPVTKTPRPSESEMADFTWNSASNLVDNYPAKSLLIITNNSGKAMQMEKESSWQAGVMEQSGDLMEIEFDISDTNPDKSNWLDNGWASLASPPTGYSKNPDGSLHIKALLPAWFKIENGETTGLSGYDMSNIHTGWNLSSTMSPYIKATDYCTPFAIKNLKINGKYSRSEYSNPVIDLATRTPINAEPAVKGLDETKDNAPQDYTNGNVVTDNSNSISTDVINSNNENPNSSNNEPASTAKDKGQTPAEHGNLPTTTYLIILNATMLVILGLRRIV